MEKEPYILHILVIGFHHKKGCQVEFSYPPLKNSSTGQNECPTAWKYLPTLALPDGSHNFVEDTVFFNIPSLTEPAKSVYGVSCYRQLAVEQLKVRTADMTRSSVQKSVCVLARLPIYGYIELKLSVIADKYFEQGDFSCNEMLSTAYEQINSALLNDENQYLQRHFYEGLSARNVLLQWRQKTLILIKLLLLQRRVIYFGSPVRGMCTLILTLSSLIPGLIEKGFQEVACVCTLRSMAPVPDFNKTLKTSENVDKAAQLSNSTEASLNATQKKLDSSVNIANLASVDTLPAKCAVSTTNEEVYDLPIPIFSNGNLCLPYLSLPYMDLLTDPSVCSYVIGTSNVLFQQKCHLSDVHVDIENTTIDVHDSDLRRQLSLSTEDVRFMDHLLHHVQTPNDCDKGHESWLREQIRDYLFALLRTAASTDISSKDTDSFNSHFMHAFKRTSCFQDWLKVQTSSHCSYTAPGHPFPVTTSVADMKYRLSQTLYNSDGGRNINQTVNNTSRAMVGAMSQVKEVFSNFWTSITMPPTTMVPSVNNDATAKEKSSRSSEQKEERHQKITESVKGMKIPILEEINCVCDTSDKVEMACEAESEIPTPKKHS